MCCLAVEWGVVIKKGNGNHKSEYNHLGGKEETGKGI